MTKNHLSKLFATITVFLGMFIAAMESLIGSTVLPSIISTLGGFDLYPWIISCFLLALIVATPIFGKLTDHWGFFGVYNIAIAFFLVGSLMCGLSQTMVQLIVSRCVQGIGTAGLITLCIVYAGLAFPHTIRHKVQAVISAIWAVSSLLGPAIGALIVTYTSWRFAFLINVPLSLLLLLGTWLTIRGIPKPKEGTPFDTFGAILFTTASLAFLLAMVRIGKDNFSFPEIGLLLASLLIIVFLLIRSKEMPNSFLNLSPMKKHPVIATSVGLAFLGGAFLFATANFSPIFIQGAQGGTFLAIGQVITAMAFGTCAGSFIAAMILSRFGFRTTSMLGSIILLIGAFGLALISLESPLWQLTLANFFTGMGIGVSANVAIVATQSHTHHTQMGSTTSIFSFFRSIGGMLAISLLGTVQVTSFRSYVHDKVLGLEHTQGLEVMNHPEFILEPQQRTQLTEVVLDTLSKSLSESIHIAFLVMFPFVILHFILSTLLPSLRPHEIERLPDINAMGE